MKSWTARSMVNGRWSMDKPRTSSSPSTLDQKPSTHRRRGTTLSEVLVSTLVMSIGVVALATLFPISVLRSIQASQLTNAAVLRYNAESQLRTVPEIINIGTEWQPSTMYQVNDTVVPSATTRARFPVSAVYVCTAVAGGGMSGATEPGWVTQEGQPTTDNEVTWTTVLLRNYVVDPLGFELVDPADLDYGFRGTGRTGAREHFGNIWNGTANNPFVLTGNRTINRFPAFGFYKPNPPPKNAALDILNEFNAATLSILPDSWTLHAEATDLAYTAGNTNILLGGVDGNQLGDSVRFATPDLVPDRIVIFDDTLRRSHTFPVIGVTANAAGAVVDWSGFALPTGFTPAKARVESLERRYSYMLSVRQRRSYSYVDVVVFFRRKYAIRNEQVYSCVFRKIDRGLDGAPGVSGVNDNGPGGPTDEPAELGYAGSDDQPRNFCIVQYHSSDPEPPFFKKGSYVCDAHNLRWYRVIDVTEDVLPPFTIANVTPTGYEVDPIGTNQATNTANDRFVRLTLDQPVTEDSPMDSTLTPVQIQSGAVVTTGGTIGGAILMPGVVDVFPLRPRSTWEEQ